MTSKQFRQPGAAVIGLGLLIISGWFAARAFEPRLMGIDRLWPFIPIMIGAALIIQFAFGNPDRAGLVFVGLVLALTGIFMCMFTFEIGRLTWFDLTRYWPLFPAIIGAGFLAMFIADGMRNEALLKPAYLIGGFGIFLLPFTSGVLGGDVFDQVAVFWPLLFIPLVIVVVIQIRNRNRAERP
jgi:hypothetical protein